VPAEAVAEPPGGVTRPVPIEAGPPPSFEPVNEPVAVPTGSVSVPPEPVAVAARMVETVLDVVTEPLAPSVVETLSEALPAEAVESAALADAPPVPANDVVAGPLVQPIVIGSETAPPVERKRGWWRRR